MGQCCPLRCTRILGLAAETASSTDAGASGAGGTSGGGDGPVPPGGSMPQCHSIDKSMSAPTIRTSDGEGRKADGSGLALADVSVEQDAAYWEWHVTVAPVSLGASGAGGEGESSSSSDGGAMMFGLSTKRNAKFYEILSGSSIPSHKHGTKFMSAVPDLSDGEHTIGVAVQQSDLPMIQLFVDGSARDDLSILKFRGHVFPSVFLPPERPGSLATFVHREDQLRNSPPQERFQTLIAARGMI